MPYRLRSEHVHFFVASEPNKAGALLATLVKNRSLISAAVIAPVLTIDGGQYVPCSGKSGYEQASVRQDTLHSWLFPDKDSMDDIATDEVGADWVPEDDSKAARAEAATGEEGRDDDDESDADKVYEVYIHLQTRPHYTNEKWAIKHLTPLISACSPPMPMNDQQILANLMCRPQVHMHGSPKLKPDGLMSYLTSRWLRRIHKDGYDVLMNNVLDTIRKYYVLGENEGDVAKALRSFEAAHNLIPVTVPTTTVVQRLQTKPLAQPYVGRCEFKHLPDPDGRKWVVEHLTSSTSPPCREERHKPLVLWSNGKRLGTSKWAQHFGVHCYMRGTIDKKYLTDCMNDPACRYIVLDEIPWNKLLDTRQPLGEELLGGQTETTWKAGRKDIPLKLGLPIIVISHRNEKPPETFLDRFNPTGTPLYVLVGVEKGRVMWDDSRPRVDKPLLSHAAPMCSCRGDAVVVFDPPVVASDVLAPPAPIVAPLVPIAVAPAPNIVSAPQTTTFTTPPAPITPPSPSISVTATSSTAHMAIFAPPSSPLVGSDSELMAVMPPPPIQIDQQLLSQAEPFAMMLASHPVAAAAVKPTFSLATTEKKAVAGLPDTWIMYDVITQEVEELLNRAAETQGGPWIEFVQSRNGKPLTRLKKVQCVCYGDWLHWYWYPDTKPDEWLPFTAINARLADLLTKLCGGVHVLTSLVLNKYRDETDNIIPHHDKTGDLEPSSSIVTLSTGPLARTIVFINPETGDEIKLTVPPRSVYSIGRQTNHTWKHSVPPMEGVTGERYGWTFRSVVSLWNRVTHARVQRPLIDDDMGVWDVLLPLANPDRPELLQSYKVVQTVRLAEPGRLQPSDLEQICDEAQAAYCGSTSRKASNPKHRKPVENKQPTQPTKKQKKRKVEAKDDERQGKENKPKRPANGVRLKEKKTVESSFDSDSDGSWAGRD